MVTILTMSGREINATLSLSGLSTDEKPIDRYNGCKIQNGSTFMEIDSSRMFMYDAQNSRWIEIFR